MGTPRHGRFVGAVGSFETVSRLAVGMQPGDCTPRHDSILGLFPYWSFCNSISFLIHNSPACALRYGESTIFLSYLANPFIGNARSKRKACSQSLALHEPGLAKD